MENEVLKLEVLIMSTGISMGDTRYREYDFVTYYLKRLALLVLCLIECAEVVSYLNF